MCTDEQHNQKMAVLKRIDQALNILIAGRPPIDRTYNISNVKGFMLDYRNRKHVYVWTAAMGLSLNLGALGTLALTQYTWTLIDFQEGFEIFATSGTTTDTAVFVRCTDEVIA